MLLNFFLYFSSEMVLVPFLIIGYFFVDKKLFSQVITLFFLGSMFNAALKVTFKVPLASFLHKEGFAFPSGHMQSSMVIYTWILFLRDSFLLKTLAVIILSCISIALVMKGYHNIFDIFGGYCAAALVLFLYNKICNNKYCNVILFIISCLLIIYINNMFKIQNYVAFSYFSLAGFLFADYYFYSDKELCYTLKTVACVLCLILFPLLHYQNNLILYFLLGMLLPSVNYLLGLFYDTRSNLCVKE